MLPYEKSRGLHQEKLNRFQAEARQDSLRSEARNGRSGLIDKGLRVVGRGLVKVGENSMHSPAADAH